MNPNVWNIKDIFSIPTGSRRAQNPDSNATTSGYSSLTYSQLFGSQFCPENSQGMSQDMSFPSRSSQQSSQEGNEQKISSNYHTKPFLFGGEGKHKGIKPLSILDFEEHKKKAKEKNESDMLAKESLHFREAFNNMQQSILGTEKNITVCRTILERFDNFAVALQQNQSSLQDGITQPFESMLKELISQKQMLTNIEGKLLETGVATAELGSYVHGLEKSLKSQKEEHVRGKKQLEEAMKLLRTFVSNHSTRNCCGGVVDSAIQTSPGLLQPFFKVQLDSQPEGQGPLCCQPEISRKSDVLQWYPRSIEEERKPSQRGHRRTRRRPLVIPKMRKITIWDENSQPISKSIKKEDCSSPRKGVSLIHYNGDHRSNEGLKDFVSPFSPWSEDSNSSVCVAGSKPTIEPVELKREIPEKARGLWQLFDIHCDSDSINVEE